MVYIGIFYLPDFTKPLMIKKLVRHTPNHLVKIYCVKDNDSEREGNNMGFCDNNVSNCHCHDEDGDGGFKLQLAQK